MAYKRSDIKASNILRFLYCILDTTLNYTEDDLKHRV